MRHIIKGFLIASIVLLSGCGDDEATTSMATALSLANTKVAATADIIGESSRRSLRTGIDSIWDTSPGVSALSNTGNSSLAQWFENMFDPTFTNSNDAKVTFAGRIDNALQIFCFLANGGLTTDATNLPADGEQTMSMTAAIGTTCGMSTAEAANFDNVSVVITTTTPSDTTLYDKSLSIVLPTQANCPFLVMARANGTAVNISTSEDQSCDSRDQASRSIFLHDVAAQTSRFTYISQNFSGSGANPAGFEFYRGYLNEATDAAYVLGHYGGDEGTSASLDGVSFTAVGKPSAGGTTAVSARSNGNTIGDADYRGCVSTTDNTVSTDDTLACTLTGTAIATAYSVVTGEYDLNDAIADIYSIGATTTVSHTDETDIFSFSR